jgi:hypothetical protein
MSKLENAFGGAPILALDFDAVIHRYTGWNKGRLDDPIPGALSAIETFVNRGFRVVIHSTRSEEEIRNWLDEHRFPPLEICSEKPPAVCFIDDRCITFNGKWTADLIDHASEFKPYWETGTDQTL